MDTIDVYIRDLGRVKILSDQECRDILPRARAGDTDARNELIESCLRLAFNQVKKACKGRIDDEWLTEANLTVCRAVDKWDGVTTSLSHYVYRSIENALSNVRRKKIIPVPAWAHQKAALLQERAISIQEEEVCNNVKKARLISSLSSFIDDPIMIVDRGKQTEITKKIDEIVSLMYKKLPPKLSEVVIRYFGLRGKEETLQDMGTELGLTRAALSFRLQEALRRIRKLLDCDMEKAA